MKKYLIVLLMSVLALSACSDRTPETTTHKTVVHHTSAPDVHGDDYYHNASNFGMNVPYYDAPYYDDFGTRRMRRVYRPNGLTAGDIAVGIVVGNMLSGSARNSGRRPVVINQTIIKKYETRGKSRRTKRLAKKKNLKRTKTVKKKPALAAKKKAPTRSASFAPKKKSTSALRIAPKRKKSRSSFSGFRKKSSSKRRRRR